MSDDKFDRIDAKLDKIVDIQNKQEVNLTRLTVTVEEHARRSDTLEKMYQHLDDEIQPIKISVNRIQAVGKFIGVYVIPLAAAVISTMHWVFKLI